MACKEHLINSPTGPLLPHLSDGFPLSAGVTPRPHWRATAAALGACPEAGLGVASEGPKPGDGGLSHQEPLLPSSERAGFLRFLSPSDRKPWAGAGTSDFLQLEGAQPGLRAPGMPGGGLWAGVEAAVKGRASERGLSPIIHLSL